MLARENKRLEHEDEAADSSEDLNDGGRKVRWSNRGVRLCVYDTVCRIAY